MRPSPRLLPLPLCIALALGAHATVATAQDREPDWGLCPVEDSVPAFPDAQAPAGAPEARAEQPTDITGDMLEGVDGGNVQYSGNVTLRRGDQFLGADQLAYDSQTSTYVASGRVRYQDSGMRLVAERLEGDQQADTHRVENVEYQLTERRGNGGADRIEMKGAVGALHGATYSTCPMSGRWWELRANRIDIDNDEGQGVARSAVLRVGKVPILYVPIFAFPTDSRRKTGLLYPAIGMSGRNGFDYRQPIYLNLAPNYDMTLEPRYMSNRGLLLGTEFRYLRPGGSGVLEVEYINPDRLAEEERQQEIEEGIPPENRRKDSRGMFRFGGVQGLDSNWQARWNLSWISDPRYLEDASNSIAGLTSYSLLSDVGIFGLGRNWDAGIQADYWQLGDYTLREANLPYNRLPRLFANWERGIGSRLVTGIASELTHFTHIDSATRPGGSRLDLKPYVSMPLEGPSWYVTPTVAWRYTGYELTDELATAIAAGSGLPANTSPSRSMPISTIDAGLFFDREALFRGERYLQTLEPRLFYLNSPYRDQRDLPLFDTQPMSFSWGQLFRDNRFSGADRQADANQLTLALTTRLLSEDDGKEKLTASIGQIRYFDETRVELAPNTPPNDRGKSAWIADTGYAINDRWSMSTTYQWDPNFRSEDLASLRTRYLIGDDGIANFSYRYRRDPSSRQDLLRQVDFSFLYPITPAWSAVGRYYYSLLDNQLLEAIAGVQWDSCCLAVRLIGRRYLRSRSGELNNAVQLEIELKGLGSAGADTQSRLRRAILGYYREDLYLVPPAQVRSGDDLTSPDALLDATP